MAEPRWIRTTSHTWYIVTLKQAIEETECYSKSKVDTNLPMAPHCKVSRRNKTGKEEKNIKAYVSRSRLQLRRFGAALLPAASLRRARVHLLDGLREGRPDLLICPQIAFQLLLELHMDPFRFSAFGQSLVGRDAEALGRTAPTVP